MPENPDLVLSDLVKGGVWGFNATSGKWKPVKVNDAGELVTTAGAGGGGVDPVRVWDGTDIANVNALGSLEVSITTNPVPVSDGGNVLSVDDAGSTLSVDDGAGSITVDQATAANLNALAAQGAPAAVANAWPIKIVDTGGVNVAAVNANNQLQVRAILRSGANADMDTTKGSQVVPALQVQEYKDAGRTMWQAGTDSNGTALTTSGTANTEVAATIAIRKGGAAQTTGSSYTVTAAKILRLTAVNLQVAHSAAGYVTFRIRLTTTLTGNILFDLETRAQAAASLDEVLSFPDGFEFAAGTVLQFSTKATVASQAVTLQLYGFEY